MQAERTLREYLDRLRECECPERMLEDFGVYDNFGIAFYGDGEEILPVLRSTFVSSPSGDGLRLKWKLESEHKKGDDIGFSSPLSHDYWYFTTSGRRVVAYLHAMGEGQPDQLNDLDIAEVSICLHPGDKKWKSIYQYITEIRPAILDIGEFIIRSNLTAKFRRSGADAYHVVS